MSLKKITTRLLTAAIIVSLFSGCSDEKHIISYDSATTEAVEEKSPKIAKKDISAVLLLPDDPDDGACMSAAHKEAFISATKDLGINAAVLPKVSDDSINEATNSANIIFGAGYDYMNLLDDKAKENPEKLFSCFGGYKYNSTNYTNYYTAIYEAQYLAGIAAGTNSTSGKIGVISEYSKEYPDSAAEINSFALGARAANPEAQIIVRSLGSRSDTSLAEQCTHSLIAEGCDVISIQCDTSIPSKVASEKDVYHIGYGTVMCDSDTDDSAELCLTSVVWDLTEYYKSAFNSAMNGTWAASNYYGTLSDNAVMLAELCEDADPITIERINSASKLINEAKFEIFSNKKIEFSAEGVASLKDAALVDNNSNIMISEDGTQCFLYSGDELVPIDPAAVTSDHLASSNMNYLVEGVIVRE
ncbi:MAG: BMP family ABC transporter substrate-binding protein [Ruminococcaceae bacterium]|nr:BMP family ABC transporter substrate-binding protein [Oscillospiraceae bacterium]